MLLSSVLLVLLLLLLLMHKDCYVARQGKEGGVASISVGQQSVENFSGMFSLAY